MLFFRRAFADVHVVCACECILVYVCMEVCACVFVYIRVCVLGGVHAHAWRCMRVFVYAAVCVCRSRRRSDLQYLDLQIYPIFG